MDFVAQNLNPYENIHNLTPEDICLKNEENSYTNRLKAVFNKYSKKEKLRIINLFLESNKNNPEFKSEVKAAKKLLETSNVRIV